MDIERTSILLTKQNDILSRLDQLSKRLNNLTPSDEITKTQQHVSDYAKSIDLKNELVRVPSPYYTWTLEQRACYLDAPSPDHLCKSIIMENIDCVNSDMSDPFNSRYYLVIIQYTTKIQNQKVLKFVKSLGSQSRQSNQPLSKANYRFTLATSEASHRMTGFEYNAVCPIATIDRIPIIVSQAILSLKNQVVWLGGGETDLKLVVDINEFIQKVQDNANNKVFVADVTYDTTSISASTPSDETTTTADS
ncbi:hypothetical protein SAMD00019534_043760 [Acytostelium subglobosum LB1]|uniref:hypothetical protein n=1 Tax=Acytostelium subglobosum LB1 TaxID=1410327 RepID=UPI000644A6C2|nr:hypothetical protein SAMD00019534_043760 [Acytostelium subglobosum LB1]GAM21201.1 hypothetical protein SAMD00019534_043760 [Acytostelium subglobosum LB1]|eukprot:XP_012756335.1 hypothetical protein SAMD00019534_043760 [Acytostelium subglobosum LB1]